MTRMRFVQLVVTVTFFLLQCCSSDDARTSPHTTAQSLLSAFQAMYTSTPPDMEGIIGLIHAENDAQESWIQYLQGRVLLARLDRESLARFGETVRGSQTLVMVWPVDSMEIEKESDDRVDVRCTEDGARPVTLYLVRVDDRWWISGYSFEHHRAHQDVDIGKLAQAVESTRSEVERVINRLRAGEFANLEELRAAIDWAYGR